MIDTGASHNYLPKVFSDGQTPDGLGFDQFLGRHDFFLADQRTTRGDVVVFESLLIENIVIKNPVFIILDNLVDDAIIGTQLMQNLGATINMRKDSIAFRKPKRSLNPES